MLYFFECQGVYLVKGNYGKSEKGDSKSPGLHVHVGSIPTSGTTFRRLTEKRK